RPPMNSSDRDDEPQTIKFWLTQDNRERRKARTSLRTKGSIPMLQASAIRTAQMLTARSPALESRSLIWVNFAVKPVRAAISSRISGKSTRGMRIEFVPEDEVHRRPVHEVR